MSLVALVWRKSWALKCFRLLAGFADEGEHFPDDAVGAVVVQAVDMLEVRQGHDEWGFAVLGARVQFQPQPERRHGVPDDDIAGPRLEAVAGRQLLLQLKLAVPVEASTDTSPTRRPKSSPMRMPLSHSSHNRQRTSSVL